jgi:hypothetical protein
VTEAKRQEEPEHHGPEYWLTKSERYNFHFGFPFDQVGPDSHQM